MAERDSLDFRADLMSGDTVAGHIRAHHVEPVCQELLPLCFQRGGDVADWLTHRAIDAHRTPELTNTGSFEKCWRYEDGAWWMYKAGTEAERFSELFVYELCKTLGFPVAEYQNCAPYIRTRDFTGGRLNFEPAAYLVGSMKTMKPITKPFSALGRKWPTSMWNCC